MDKSKKALIIVSVFVITIISYLKLSDSRNAISETSKNDLEILKGAPSTEMDKFSSIVRLGSLKNLEAIPLIKRNFNSFSSNNKKMSLEILGLYSDIDSLSFIAKYIEEDTSEELRISSLKALGSRKDQSAKEYITKYLNIESKFTQMERVILYESAVKSFKGSAISMKTQDKLLRLSNSKNIEVKSELMRVIATNNIVNSNSKKIVKDLVTNEMSVSGYVFAFKYLSIHSRDWIISNAKLMITDKNRERALAFIQTIHLSCPQPIWDLLKLSLGYKDLSSVTFNSLSLYNFKEALEFFKNNKEFLGEKELVRVKSTLEKKKTKSNCF